MSFLLFFFNDTATTEIYTLSLHDALPISHADDDGVLLPFVVQRRFRRRDRRKIVRESQSPRALVLDELDRKSTRLNSSHANISYAVFCLKKKKKKIIHTLIQKTCHTFTLS